MFIGAKTYRFPLSLSALSRCIFSETSIAHIYDKLSMNICFDRIICICCMVQSVFVTSSHVEYVKLFMLEQDNEVGNIGSLY